ncbi:hypothetical protein QW060_20335 [Myroides ceti]|uniref:Uncharacterized protein n=1 Tax=Paenimyroides ceti TaxID=395087 RepID=A0ABT8CYR1_9FLAO|nr:hypothetical protein [Paenimyroides ceti]MDN3709364.1 hypothetical protein [Paenimyroides ceti]
MLKRLIPPKATSFFWKQVVYLSVQINLKMGNIPVFEMLGNTGLKNA